ncbi:transcription factor DIVARICATA-like [Senna tora]|uniref:Transcription factor DIVARICATA-like n=1 Tax=Senna tora TaxID=362788 RepID=A0A834TZ21_9FABA|nr:transcription factor DIVARICATA-like [Senna tora]
MPINSDWFVQESHTEWTKEENKRFESALAIYDKDTPDRWLKVAAMIPGKTVYDVIKQYKELVQDIGEIEAGRVPLPGYDHLPSSFAFQLLHHHHHQHNYDDAHYCRKRPPVPFKGCDQERKKGVPWTEEEHRRFLMGLMKYGKGDWRNISRNFVVTKTPTQVASHAQKYYIRQKLSGGNNNNNNSSNNNNNSSSNNNNKRRPSIHDITILNLTESSTSSEDNNKPLLFNHKLPNDGVFNFNPNFSSKLQEQDLYDSALHEAYSYYTNKASVLGIHAL